MGYNDIDKAHKDYLIEKEEIITKLYAIRDAYTPYNIRDKWINEIIEFIKGTNL